MDTHQSKNSVKSITKDDQSMAANRIINSLKNGSHLDQKIGKIVEYINQGSNLIRPEDEEVYMLLGPTGAGKTTLAAYLSGLDLVIKNDTVETTHENYEQNDEEEDEEEEEEEEGEERKINITQNYLDYKQKVETYGKIGVSDLESETIVPNKFISHNGSIFWDCPGFQDSRGEEIDIANSYYISKIPKDAKKIKFILVIDGLNFQDKGFGANKGQALKILLETLFQMSRGTGIDYGKHLTIVVSRTSHFNLKQCKNKLKDLFEKLSQHDFFINKITKLFQKSDLEQFFDQIKKAKVCLFPCPKGNVGEILDNSKREKILKAVNSTNFYTERNINVPHCIGSLESLIELWKYTRDQLRIKFKKLCQSFGEQVELMGEKNFSKVQQLVNQFYQNYKLNDDFSNSQFLNVIKNSFIFPFIQIVNCNNSNNDTFHAANNALMEEIEFILVQIYDELLSGVKLSQDTQKFFGKITYFELQEGISILYKIIQLQEIAFDKQKMNQTAGVISIQELENKLALEIINQVQCRMQTDKAQLDLVTESLQSQFKISNETDSKFLQSNNNGMFCCAVFGALYGSELGMSLGPVGFLFGGILGGLIGVYSGNLADESIDSLKIKMPQKCSIF